MKHVKEIRRAARRQFKSILSRGGLPDETLHNTSVLVNVTMFRLSIAYAEDQSHTSLGDKKSKAIPVTGRGGL
jgi:hypothetical protein